MRRNCGLGALTATALALVALAGCATAARPRPGTGDIAFRLRWKGAADVDLYVTSPLGERIDFVHRQVASGGRLDVDCNAPEIWFQHPGASEGSAPDAPPEAADDQEVTELPERVLRVCPRPMENVFWPQGGAPQGDYEYAVILANPNGMDALDRWRLEVRLGERVWQRFGGRVRDLEAQPLTGKVRFPPAS